MLGCTQYEDHEYDIPAGEQVGSVALEIDADGTPVILADVQMFYATRESLETWESPIQVSDIQSIAYSRDTGVWRKYGFRNLQYGFSGKSMLLRDDRGGVRPFIANRGRQSLYGRGAGGWTAQSSGLIDPPGWEVGFVPDNLGNPLLILVGQDWLNLTYGYNSSRISVARRDGSGFALDSSEGFQPAAFAAVGDDAFLVGSWQRQNPDFSQPNPFPVKLAWYSWDARVHDPKPRLKTRPMDGYFLPRIAKVGSEYRLYAFTGIDSLQVFAIRGGDLVLLESRAMPVMGDARNFWNGFSLIIDSAGCFHGVGSIMPDWNDSTGPKPPYPSGIPMLYASTCKEGRTIFTWPDPKPGAQMERSLSSLRLDRQGRPVAALLFKEIPKNVGDPAKQWKEDQKAQPTWLYFGTLADKGWEWEPVAHFEGTGGT